MGATVTEWRLQSPTVNTGHDATPVYTPDILITTLIQPQKNHFKPLIQPDLINEIISYVIYKKILCEPHFLRLQL